MRLALIASVASLVLVGGCATQPSTTGTSTAAGEASPTSTASSAQPQTTGDPAIPNGYDANRNASADIKTALATAAHKHQEVLVDFGADWCPDCVALDSMFRSHQVEPLLTNDYVVVAVDVGTWNLNLDVAGRYLDLHTSGIPALVVLTPSGKVITTTNDGSFSNARTMAPSDVAAFLTKWAPGAH